MKFPEPIDPFADDRRAAFWVLQAVAFGVTAYLYASWNLQGIAFLDPAFLEEPTRESLYSFWKRAPFYYPTFQFIYEWVSLTPDYLRFLQLLIVGFSLLGLMGFVPKAMAVLVFALHAHLAGLFLIANDTMDASTTLLAAALLILALSPSGCFYALFRFRNSPEPEGAFWPVYLFWIVAAFYYWTAGLNKVIEVGPHWPFWVRIDRYATWAQGASTLETIRYGHPWVWAFMSSYWIALSTSVITLMIELSAPLLLFRFRGRSLLALSYPMMHLFIFLTMGYGYLIYMALDVALLDWNRMLKRSERLAVGR